VIACSNPILLRFSLYAGSKAVSADNAVPKHVVSYLYSTTRYIETLTTFKSSPAQCKAYTP